MSLGQKIRVSRKSCGMTQEQLADVLDISRVTISSWENDDNTPTVENIVLISRALSVTTDYLLSDFALDPNLLEERENKRDPNRQFLALFNSLAYDDQKEVIRYMEYRKYIKIDTGNS